MEIMRSQGQLLEAKELTQLSEREKKRQAKRSIRVVACRVELGRIIIVVQFVYHSKVSVLAENFKYKEAQVPRQYKHIYIGKALVSIMETNTML